MKKAISSEIFIYIFGMIVVGIILIFGYQKIAQLTEAQNSIEIPRLQKQIESLAKSAMGSGNVILEDVVLPKGFEEICIIDLDKAASTSLNTGTDEDKRPIIYDSWSDKIQKNVYLVGKKTESFYIDKLKPSGAVGVVCIKLTDGRAKLRFEGKGSYTLVDQHKIAELPI